MKLLYSLQVFMLCVSIAQAQINENDLVIIDTLDLSVDLFDQEEPLHFTIKFNVKQFQRNKYKNDYVNASLIYQLNDSTAVRRNVRIKPRGNFRKDFCGFPPIQLNIKKTKAFNPYMENVNKVKMVTHCQKGPSFEQYLRKEYLTYKLYNIISDYSFKVQFVEVKYIDTGRKNKETKTWGFFIEPEFILAERQNAMVIKRDNLMNSFMQPDIMDRLCLFQYMVGNCDYSVAGRHNMKIVKPNTHLTKYLIPVPYDFDYSGIVNAYYAVPGDNLGIKRVTERYYLGPCRGREDYKNAIEYFLKKKQELIMIIENDDILSPHNKSEMLNYVLQFFELAENEERLVEKLEKTCLKIKEYPSGKH